MGVEITQVVIPEVEVAVSGNAVCDDEVVRFVS